MAQQEPGLLDARVVAGPGLDRGMEDLGAEVRAVLVLPGGQRRTDANPAGAPAAALAAPAEAVESGVNWLVLILFVIGCAIGGALFTLFMPF